MADHTPFLTIFPGCERLSGAAGGLDKAYVTDVQVDLNQRTMSVAASFGAMPSPVDIQQLTECLRLDYGLSGVGIIPDYPRIKSSASVIGRPARRAPQGRAARRSWEGPSSRSPCP